MQALSALAAGFDELRLQLASDDPNRGPLQSQRAADMQADKDALRALIDSRLLEMWLRDASHGRRVAALAALSVFADEQAGVVTRTALSLVVSLCAQQPLFVQDCARKTLYRLVTATPPNGGSTLGRASLAWLEMAIVALPQPSDGDASKRQQWHEAMQSQLRVRAGPTYGHLLGSVLGQCVGDALGFLVEGQSRAVCTHFAEQVALAGRAGEFGVMGSFGQDGQPRYRSLAEVAALQAAEAGRAAGPRPPPEVAFAFGQFTDDSQLMRELLCSYAAAGDSPFTFDGAAFGRRVAALFAGAGLLTGPVASAPAFGAATSTPGFGAPSPSLSGIVGYGRTTRKAAQRLADGVDWRSAGMQSGQGNGGCMRVGPLGLLLYHRSWEVLLAEAAAQCSVTHATRRCQASAVLVAGAVRLAVFWQRRVEDVAAQDGRAQVHDAQSDAQAFCDELATYVCRIDDELAEALRAVPATFSLSLEQAVPTVTAIGRRLGDSMWAEGDVISAGAVQSSLWALRAFLRQPNSFLPCVAEAIAGGGDADTTAAMAGAMVGARVGVDALPHEYVARINDRGHWRAEGFHRLCASLADKAGLVR